MLDRYQHFFSIVSAKIRMNLVSEIRRTKLGYAWWVLEPLFEALIFYLVFEVFFAQSIENFAAFLLCGLVPWTWFSRSVSNGMNSIILGSHLLTNFRIHPIFFPLVEIGQDAVKQLFAFSFLIFFLLVFGGVTPSVIWLFLVPLMLLQLALVSSFTTLMASLTPRYRDLRQLVPVLLLMGMFSSGIFYDPFTVLTEPWKSFYFLNPMACLVTLYRDVLLSSAVPSLSLAGVVLLWSLVLYSFTFFVMRRYRFYYPKLVIS